MVHESGVGQCFHVIRLSRHNITILQLRRETLKIVRVLDQVVLLESFQAEPFAALVLLQVRVYLVDVVDQLWALVLLLVGESRHLKEMLDLFINEL